LVRHGESTWNATGQWQGQEDVPLSARGRLEARALAERLFGASFDRRVASDLSRALETAQALGVSETDRRLREIDVGAWAGLHREEVAARFPEELRALRSGQPVRIGGGESMPEFEARIDAVIDELRGTHDGQEVLAVTHGGVVRALVTRVLGVRGQLSPLVGVGNTSLSHVIFESAPQLAVYNDATHLDPADLEPAVMPEPTARVALVAADPCAAPDRHLADRILSRLGIARFGAAGVAAGLALSDDLVAEPLGEDPRRALTALRAEQDGGAFALVVTPGEVVDTLGSMLGLPSIDGLVAPVHGAVAQLRVSGRGAVLHSYGVVL
jgi:broad specificity phosphatase PhoE